MRNPTLSLNVRLLLVVSVVAFAGCRGTLYSQTGSVMSNYTVDHMVPFMMGSDDVAMACETGVSMGSFLSSFERVTDAPNRAGVVTMLSAAMCAEGTAWEEELRQLRAIRAEDTEAAQDARISEKRAHRVAAGRFHRAFALAEAEWGTVGEGCPELEEPEDQLIYLLALSAGLLAVVHDRAAEGSAGVPMSIPMAITRATQCVDSNKWWGAPDAMKAALWISVPGAAPKDADPWAELEAATAAGETAAVRLARAFQAQAAATVGREDVLRGAISQHGTALEATAATPQWSLLDRYGTLIVRHESDKIWTRETGHRTPMGALGTFHSSEDVEVDDSLLEGLED